MNHEYSAELLAKDYDYQKLFSAHSALEERLDALVSHPSAPREEVARLKKLKLKMVDQMQAIEMKGRRHH
jgi:uncharacterized protein YdcH (DUF465 family)